MRDVGDISLRRCNEKRDTAICTRLACVELFIGRRGGTEGSPGAPDHLGVPSMSVLGMLAWFAAAVSLWLGARQHAHAGGLGPAAAGGKASSVVPSGQHGAFTRGYRWLAGAAALYCAGLIIQQ